MMRHITTHLATIDEAAVRAREGDVRFARRGAGQAAGRGAVGRKSGRDRASGSRRSCSRSASVGRRTVERLKSSPNAAVRRTAIYLLREFGGSEALPDLTELLDDNEPQVQREAVRAILNIGTDAAVSHSRAGADQRHRAVARGDHAVAQRGARRARDAAVRLHRSATSTIAARSRRSICARSNRSARCAIRKAIAPLKEALYKGEWWAPRRTSILRSAAAAALARIGTAEALCRARRSGRLERIARRPQRGAPACLERRGGRGPRDEDALVTAPRVPARRRAAAPLRRVAPLGAALLERPSDHRPQPRVAVGGHPAAARPRAVDRHRPRRRRSHRRRHADGQGRGARPARPPAAAERRRAHHHRPRRHASKKSPAFVDAVTSVEPRGNGAEAPTALPDVAAHPRRTRHRRTARRRQPRRHGHHQAAVQRRRLGGRQPLGQRGNRRHARRDDGARR